MNQVNSIITSANKINNAKVHLPVAGLAVSVMLLIKQRTKVLEGLGLSPVFSTIVQCSDTEPVKRCLARHTNQLYAHAKPHVSGVVFDSMRNCVQQAGQMQTHDVKMLLAVQRCLHLAENVQSQVSSHTCKLTFASILLLTLVCVGASCLMYRVQQSGSSENRGTDIAVESGQLEQNAELSFSRPLTTNTGQESHSSLFHPASQTHDVSPAHFNHRNISDENCPLVLDSSSDDEAMPPIKPSFDISTEVGRAQMRAYVNSKMKQRAPSRPTAVPLLQYGGVNETKPFGDSARRVYVGNRGWIGVKQLDSEEETALLRLQVRDPRQMGTRM